MNPEKLKLYLLLSAGIILFSSQNNSYAQDSEASGEESKTDTTEIWKAGGLASITFNQTSLSNWVKGGESSVSGTGAFNFSGDYNKDNLSWENTIDLAYGLLTSDQYSARKTEDKIDVNSKVGYKAVQNLFYTGLVNFKSQFYKGYDYPNDSVKVSDFFAPAFLITSLGMDYKVSENFSVYLSPVTGRFIFMMDQDLANAGAYGVTPAKVDTNGNIITEGKKLKPAFGAYLTCQLKYEVMENVNFKSKLELFNNFTDPDKSNRKNIDVNFETTVFLKVNEFISANIYFQMIYDHEQKVPVYRRINGVKTQVDSEPRLQIKHILGLGLSYNFKM